MEGLGVAANVIQVVNFSVEVASSCLQYAKAVKHAKADIDRLSKHVKELEGACREVQLQLQSPNGARLKECQKLDDTLKQGLAQLETVEQKLKPTTAKKAMSRIGLRALKWPFKHQDFEELLQGFTQTTQAIFWSLQLDQTSVLLEVDRNVANLSQSILNVDQKVALSSLPVAVGATFDSHAEEHNPTCLENTRVDLLSRVSDWASDPLTLLIFWLNGAAGTGKSTISRTLCRSFVETGRLGGSFFFKRGEADRGSLSKFFTTIAAQLVERHAAIARHVKESIDSNPNISGKTAREQFEKLILQPLLKHGCETQAGPTLVIVIDALDECERDTDIRLIISLFSRAKDLRGLLRIFVTSRPELPIRLGFSDIKGTYRDLILQDIPLPVIEHDIAVFLEQELAKLRADYNVSVTEDRQLPCDWPGERNVRILVEMSIPLFIFAATICRFLSDRRWSPDDQLNNVLQLRTKSQESQLDATYLPVLNKLVIGLSARQQDNVLERFRNIVGSIVVLATPLSISALQEILDVPKATIDSQLDMLHSVLSIPQSPTFPVRLLHLSFRNFLSDPEKKGKHLFWVDETLVHAKMATHCLRIMRGFLRTDICDLRSLRLEGSTINSREVDTHIPAEIQYACLYWVFHLRGARGRIDDISEAYGFLKQHFLHWIEVLSLIRRALESISIMNSLRGLLQDKRHSMFSDFLDDALRILQANLSILNTAPLQIYYSALLFAPRKSIIRNLFESEIPGWIRLKPRTEGNWDQCIQKLEGHNDYANSVVFSHDSSLVASASDDRTVRVWRADTGECIQELESQSCSVLSVAFSHDSSLIASGSDDGTVEVWCADTGECVQELKGHSCWVNSVTFSHDSSLVASASSNGPVRVWRTDTGECIWEIEGHSGPVLSVAFSHDLSLVMLASSDGTVWVWHADMNKCIQEIEGHIGRVNSVAFSHDLSLVISASDDGTVWVWRADTGKCIQEIKGHSDRVNSVAFSHDLSLVASASSDRTVRVWRTDTGECIQELKGHSGPVLSVVLSHDSSLVASASSDRTVCVWRADMNKCIQELEGHGDWVSSVAFSYDLPLVASAAGDGTVRLWHTDTGECIREFKGHSVSVLSVAFSHDSSLVVSASCDGTVRAWRTDTGECVQELKGHSGQVKSAAFSKDSSLVISASYDKVRVWRTDTGECIREIKGHRDWVNSVAFSHDSSLVISASDDKTVRVWRVDTGECIQELNSGDVSRLFFEPGDLQLLLDVGTFSSTGTNTILHATGYGLNRDKSWITWNGNNLLWLPVEYRQSRSAIRGSSVVLGCRSGRVSIVTFSTL